MSISIIIPNYNGEKILERNLATVVTAAAEHMRVTTDVVEIVIVDDGSKDNSVSVIEQFIKENERRVPLVLIKQEKNHGFATTVNTGVKRAKGEIVVLLNTDCRPEKNFLQPLLKHFKEETVFAVGCEDKSIEGEKVVLRGRGVGVWKRGFLMHKAGSLDKQNTLWVNGGSGAFRKSTWENLGGLLTVYNPFYWEDIDLSYRARKAGFQTLFEPESKVVHDHEKGAIKTSTSEEKITATAYRNQFFFVWINAGTALLLSHFGWLPYHILAAKLRDDSEFFAGCSAAIKQLPTIFTIRQKVQRQAKLPDDQVLIKK